VCGVCVCVSCGVCVCLCELWNVCGILCVLAWDSS